MILNKDLKTSKGIAHLYNPKEEGVGSYDVNYINAYKKEYRIKNKQRKASERYAA